MIGLIGKKLGMTRTFQPASASLVAAFTLNGLVVKATLG